jgi:hypothetical protein
MRIAGIVTIITLALCAITTAPALTIDQKEKISSELMSSLENSGYISSVDVNFGKDLTSDVIKVRIVPNTDMYYGQDPAIYNQDYVSEKLTSATAEIIKKYLQYIREYNEDLELEISVWGPGIRSMVMSNKTISQPEHLPDESLTDLAYKLRRYNADLFSVDVLNNGVVVVSDISKTYDNAAEVARSSFEELYQNPQVKYVVVLHPPTTEYLGLNVDVTPIIEITDELKSYPTRIPQFNNRGVKWVFTMTRDEAEKVSEWKSLNMSTFMKVA